MKSLFNVKTLAEYGGMIIALAVLIITFSLLSEHFFDRTTLITIANQIPDTMVVACGMTFILIIAGIDLSVGSVMALSGAVLGISLSRGIPLPVAVLACLAVGGLCGLANGWISVRWQLPSFIVTLGMLEAARGGTYLITNSQTQYLSGKLDLLTELQFLGLALPFWLALVIVIAGQIILSGTAFGRHALTVGANEEAARLSGIRTGSVKRWVFILSGVMASLSAIFHCARLSAADPNAGIGFELEAIAATVIGGTSLMGGRGSVISTFLGVIIIAVLGYGLAQINAQEHTKRVITGGVIVAAVILDYYRQRLGQNKKTA